MNNSIIGKLSFSDENIAKQTIKYLQKMGLGRDKYRKEDINYMRLEDIYIIEFKEKPFIFKILEYNNFFTEKNYIYITCISEYGLSFYIAGRELGDGSIFVPMNNINCIHTIEKKQINRHICFQEDNS